MNRSIDTTISTIDRLAYRTWPAAKTEPLGGWIMRASEGITKRANSVWTNGALPDEPGWIEKIERFYSTRGLPVTYQISDATDPALDQTLERAGYHKDSPCHVWIAESASALQSSQPSDSFDWTYAAVPDQEWMNRFLEFEGFSEERRPTYERMFPAIEPPACFALLYSDNRPVAVGTVVTETGWGGFTNIVVSPEFRGNGAGKQLMSRLIRHSVSMGAERLYLQVMDDNTAAHALYRGFGFRPLYAFHYRTAPESTVT